jgi:hypothetical protein
MVFAATALSFSTPVFAQYQEVEVRNGGTIEGTIRYSGKPPTPKKITITKDPKICGLSRNDDAMEVSADRGVKNVVVYLPDMKFGKKLTSDMKPVLDQKDCHYLPHVQVVPVHATLQIKSQDPILHNVHSFLNGSTVINFAMPPQKDLVLTRKLDKPGGQQLKCDVHSFMRGGIFVAETPYWALTDAAGKFEIKDVPPGTYTVNTWHEAAGPISQSVTVATGGKTIFDGAVR